LIATPFTAAFAAAKPVLPQAGDADNQVRALDQVEWSWRAKQFWSPDDDMTSRAGYLPHVDPESQQRQRQLDDWIAAGGKNLNAVSSPAITSADR